MGPLFPSAMVSHANAQGTHWPGFVHARWIGGSQLSFFRAIRLLSPDALRVASQRRRGTLVAGNLAPHRQHLCSRKRRLSCEPALHCFEASEWARSYSKFAKAQALR